MKTKEEIIALYYSIIDDEDEPSTKYLELQKKFSNLLDEINSAISESEKKKLEHLLDYAFAMSKEQEENAFFYGYKSATTTNN